MEQAIARDPHYGPALAWAAVCCFRLLFDNRSKSRAATLKRALISHGELQKWPDTTQAFWSMPRHLAACYAHMRRLDEARAIIRQLRALPAVVIPDTSYVRNPEHRELFLSGLRLATGETT